MKILTIKSEINKNLNVIIRTVSGEMRVPDVKGELDKSLVHPDFKKNMNAIWDITKADLRAASTSEVLDVIAYISENIPKRGEGYKIAVVASSEMSLVTAKMFDTYTDKSLVDIHAFNVLDDALKWIEEKN